MNQQEPAPVFARTAEEVGQALARGDVVEVLPEIAAECGAEPGDPDEFEDVREAHRHPYGPGIPA